MWSRFMRKQGPVRKYWWTDRRPLQRRDDRRDDHRGDLHGVKQRGSHHDDLRDDFCDGRSPCGGLHDDCSQRDVRAEVVECHNRAVVSMAVIPSMAAASTDCNLAVEFPMIKFGRL